MNMSEEDPVCRQCWQKYFKDFKRELNNNLDIVWLPESFSQSKFTNSTKGSNACTLIVLLLSKQIESMDRRNKKREDFLAMDSEESELNLEILYILAESILQGNLLHEQLLAQNTVNHMNLSIPEAINAGGHHLTSIKEWNSFLLLKDLEDSLYSELNEKLSHCMSKFPQRIIYVILIALNRSVLFVIERRHSRISLIDSHQHAPYGSVIVQTQPPYLENLCSWYCSQLRHKCSMYELSFMYFPISP
ncbi:hypothetical protein WDU94_000893 [Cyamophila willieti]